MSSPARTSLSGPIGLALCLVLAALFLPVSPSAAADGGGHEWRFALTPYLWVPTVDGALKYDVAPDASGRPEVSVGPTDWLEGLDFAMLLSGEARRGRFSLFGDLIYLKFSTDVSRVRSVDVSRTVPGRILTVAAGADLGTESELEGLQAMLVAGYTVLDEPRVSADAFGGVRYFRVDASTDWRLAAAITGPRNERALAAGGTISGGEDILDGVVGVRGRVRLDRERWSLPYYLDVGTGTSHLTWQAMGGVAYRFDWGELLAVYRHLEYRQDDDSLVQELIFSGPALGARFTF